jgi:hypothetical protein
MVKGPGAFAACFALGMSLMYFADPERGARRRAGVRARIGRSSRRTSESVSGVSRDVAHRMSGMVARLRAARDRHPVDDRILIERVRAQLGRHVSHPHAITVAATDGIVTVRGPILRVEVPDLLKAVERVRGVSRVVSELNEYNDTAGVPALQGGNTRPSEHRQRGWLPSARAVAGAAGTALSSYGASRRRVSGAILAATGVGLFARAATHAGARRHVAGIEHDLSRMNDFRAQQKW